jgi:hypothetical protein
VTENGWLNRGVAGIGAVAALVLAAGRGLTATRVGD